jgi:hypothetical protein
MKKTEKEEKVGGSYIYYQPVSMDVVHMLPLADEICDPMMVSKEIAANPMMVSKEIAANNILEFISLKLRKSTKPQSSMAGSWSSRLKYRVTCLMLGLASGL